ncbi:hypothetical protein EDD85DRAFT_865918 [Armillaria nabsnona]|nr:hypothetical protein EDD85DRAFT_865918 [Armillaria nabsnona]
MSALFLCSGCHNMDLASEPVAVCHCGQFWCSQICLGMSFRMHIIQAPSLEHKFVDYYPTLDEGKTFPDPRNNCIRGLIFHQYRAAPQAVPLKFVFRRNDDGEIAFCRPQVNGFFPPAHLAYRRMQLKYPHSANDTVVSLSYSLELNKLWYGSVVAVMLEKTESRKRYTNVQYHHLNLFGRFFRSSTSPRTVY